MKVIHFIRVNSVIRASGFLSVFLFIALFSLTLAPISFHTDTTEAAPGTATESTITLDVTNDTASVDLTVNSTNGTFATSTANNEASFSVTTNNYTGYTLSISAADDTGTLDNGDYNLSSIASNLTESEFNTTTNNGKWGYKPSKYYISNEVVDNTGEDSVFLSSPTTEATTLDVTNTANNEANSYTIGLGARADYSSSAGTYAKTFTLTAVGNPINYSITYNANAGTDTVTNMPYESTNNIQTGDTSSTTITLSDLVPVREDYTFKGWCSTTTSDETCSGDTYNPDGGGTNLTYEIDQTTMNVIELHAMWNKITPQYQFQVEYVSGLSDYGEKEGLDPNETESYTTALTDVGQRTSIEIDTAKVIASGYKYDSVKFLLDGEEYIGWSESISGSKHIFQILGHNEGIHSLKLNITIIPSLQVFKDSYCGITAYDPRYSENESTASLMTRIRTSSINGQCWTETDIFPTGVLTSSDTNLPENGTYTISKGEPGGSTSTEGYTQNGKGYDYCAASAGTICTDARTLNTDTAQYDICPYGWRLPNSTELANATAGFMLNAKVNTTEYTVWSSDYGTDPYSSLLRYDFRKYRYTGSGGSDNFYLYTSSIISHSYTAVLRDKPSSLICVKK